MVPDGGLMKSFAGFLYIVAVRWLSESSWRSSSGISESLIGMLEVALDHGHAKLLHEKAIKQRCLVHVFVWHARSIVIVVLWYIKKRWEVKNISFLSRIFQSSGKKKGNGYRLAIVRYFSRGELSSLPRCYISPPIDEKFRRFLSNLDASMPTSMLVEVGGGISSTNFLALKHGQERQPTPKNGAEEQ